MDEDDEYDDIPDRADGASKADSIDLYLKEISNIPLLTADQEVLLAQRIAKGDAEARRKLILSNLRLVVSMARRFMGRGLELSDLIAEGNLGLIKAVDGFDPERKTRFSTYAIWWIKQSISRAIADQGRTIRLPVHMTGLVNKWLQVSRQLTQKLGRRPTITEVANDMGISEERVKHIANLAQKPVSLEAPISEPDELQLFDLLADINATSPVDQLDQGVQWEEVMKLLDNLKEKEKGVLVLRFGLEDDIPRTLEEIGEIYGLTRERVRQIELEAITKLRRIIRTK